MNNGPWSSGVTKPVGTGSRLLLTVFFLFFFGMGSAFTWLVARDALAGLRTWSWRKTECRISRSAVVETDQRGRRSGDYFVDVAYRYTMDGRAYDSGSYSLRQTSFRDYSKAARLVEAYQPGASALCYVNPGVPSQALLQRGSLLFPFLTFFPLIFVAIGGIGIYSAWRPASAKATATANRPISDRAKGGLGQGVATAFFGLFMGVGLLVFYLVSVRPFAGILSARSWPTVPCTVISSDVRSHRGDHGSTYSVNILYSYVFNDREYKANRYDFIGGSSSGYDGKRAIVNRYWPGSQAFCYVNPTDPTAAVLQRGFTPTMWIGLLPLVFVLLGFVGLVSSVRKRRERMFGQPAASARLFNTAAASVVPVLEPNSASSPLFLRPRASPSGKFIGCAIAALFWNGIISVFLVHLVKGWRLGPFELFLALFLIPFVLIGLGLVVATGYFLLALFNPRPQLTLVPGAPRLGDSVRLDWEISGRVEALENLELSLVGREEATYTRGTQSMTDTSIFANVEIARTNAAQEMRSGSGSVVIPANLMHSFASRHNRIVWSVRVKGEIARWPDLNEEFAVSVFPGGNQTQSL